MSEHRNRDCSIDKNNSQENEHEERSSEQSTESQTKELNFSDLFCAKYAELFSKHKKNNGKIKQHTFQIRYNNLMNFIGNGTYWSLFNYNYVTKKPLPGKELVPGKYMNELHNYLVQRDFYHDLYRCVLEEYLKFTKYETLSTIAIDSCFIRNKNCEDSDRNPKNGNKPGHAIHAIVDSRGVPISLVFKPSTVHDSTVITELFDNKFVSDEVLSKYCHTFLADSSYTTFNVTDYVTQKGLNYIGGRNSRAIKKVVKIVDTSDELLTEFRGRTRVENFFSYILQRPCVIINPQKKMKSYFGLLLFCCSSFLAKKHNKNVRTANDANYARCEEAKRSAKKVAQRELYERRKKEAIDKNNKKEIEKKKREKDTRLREDKLNTIIWKNVDQNKVKQIYEDKLKAWKHFKSI